MKHVKKIEDMMINEEFNHWIYQKLKDDLLQSKYNLNKYGAYSGELKEYMEKLIDILKK